MWNLNRNDTNELIRQRLTDLEIELAVWGVGAWRMIGLGWAYTHCYI